MCLLHLPQMTHSQRSIADRPDLFHRQFHQEKYQATEVRTKEITSTLKTNTSGEIPTEVRGEGAAQKPQSF